MAFAIQMLRTVQAGYTGDIRFSEPNRRGDYMSLQDLAAVWYVLLICLVQSFDFRFMRCFPVFLAAGHTAEMEERNSGLPCWIVISTGTVKNLNLMASSKRRAFNWGWIEIL